MNVIFPGILNTPPYPIPATSRSICRSFSDLQLSKRQQNAAQCPQPGRKPRLAPSTAHSSCAKLTHHLVQHVFEGPLKLFNNLTIDRGGVSLESCARAPRRDVSQHRYRINEPTQRDAPLKNVLRNLNECDEWVVRRRDVVAVHHGHDNGT